jgi:FkbM family methyltransferase
MASVLRSFTALGGHPATVFDVGAAHGTPDLYDAFRGARFVLVEPLAEFVEPLQRVAKTLPNSEIVNKAVSRARGEASFNVHPDLVGSSFHLEPEEHLSVNGVVRPIPTTTLDALASDLGLSPPFFLKIDTQGHESDVLAGAKAILPETCGLLIELSLFNFFEGAPTFAELIGQLADLGFVIYDVCDRRYRLLDGALGQFDAMFVPEASELRRFHRYASDEQRERQTRTIQAHLRRHEWDS